MCIRDSAWMQARAAAPPAHPRVTGDHHA
ncbi:hypothetical protein, partial [Pseudomonas aeruginosa]